MNSKLRLLVAGMVAAGIATTVAAKEFRSSDVHPEDYPTVMAVKFMSDQMDKVAAVFQRTNGRADIEVDGGIDDRTAGTSTKAGANAFVVFRLAGLASRPEVLYLRRGPDFSFQFIEKCIKRGWGPQ